MRLNGRVGALVLAMTACGCAGDLGEIAGDGGTVVTTGGVTSGTGTSQGTYSQKNTPQQIQVVLDASGNVSVAVLPAGESIAAEGSLAVVQNGSPLITGLSLSKYRLESGRPNSAPTNTQPPAGEIDVDGTNTGLLLTANGIASGNLALTSGNHTITYWGPFVLASANQKQNLNISSSISFTANVNPDGSCSLPAALSMSLPSNSSTWSNGNFVEVIYGPEFLTGTATLGITASSISPVSQPATILNGYAVFHGFLPTGTLVSASGLESISFGYTP